MAESTGFTRRHFLTVATVVTGGAGAIATAVPFVSSFKPSARAQALGAPVEVDVSKLELGRAAEGRVARPADLHPAPLRRDARALKDTALRLRDPDVEGLRAARLREERASQHQARVSRAGRRLHAPRLRAAASLRGGARPISGRLAGRLLLPVPRLEVRPRGPRLQGRSGADEPGRAAVPVRQRQHDPDRLGHGERIDGEHRSRRLRPPGPRLERARRVDRRSLPDDEAHQGARHRVLRVEELQHLVLLRRRSPPSCS